MPSESVDTRTPRLLAASLCLAALIGCLPCAAPTARAAGTAGIGDLANGIARDSQGNIYVVGESSSTTSEPDFATTPGASQVHLGAGAATNAFVARYDRAGRLRWATLLGGSGADAGFGLAADGQGGVVLTGWTISHDFPATAGAPNPRFGSGTYNAFAARFDASGQRLLATYLGGLDGNLGGRAVAAGDRGTFVVAANTRSDYKHYAALPVDPATGPEGPANGDHALLGQYDASGRVLWTAFPGGAGDAWRTWKIAGGALAAVLVVAIAAVVLGRSRTSRRAHLLNALQPR